MKTRLIIPTTIAVLLAGTGLVAAQGMSRDAPGANSTIERGSQLPETKGQSGQPAQRGDKVQRNESKEPMNNRVQTDQKERMDRSGAGSVSDGKAMNKEGDKAGRGSAETKSREPKTTGQAASGSKLTQEQRTTIRGSVQSVQPANNISFSVRVGARVPRRVSFHPLPAEIVTIYPSWRRYEFFRVGDEIVVVNPRTLKIVAVLDV